MRKNFFLVKLFILVIIFIWIFKTVNINETIKVFSKTNLYYFSLALLLNNLSNFFLTIKWYRLATPLKIKSGFIDLLKLNYISTFYSMFIPGQASGELIKGLILSKKEGSTQKVWVPIFIDKVTNLLVTFLIGFIAVLNDIHFRQNTYLLVGISIFMIIFLAFTIILFSEKTQNIVSFFRNILITVLELFKIKADFIKDFSLTYFESYKKNDKLIFETMLWSILIKLPHIVAFYFLALSINLPLDLIESAWLFSVIFIASILPITFAGLGVREGTILILLAKLGIENSKSLSYSLLIFTNGLITALIGGGIEFLRSLKQKHKKHD